MLKIAVPNKGALSEGAVRLLSESGYRCTRSGRELTVADTENDIEFLFLRPRDIALYVGTGIIDLGLTGRDLAFDSGAGVHELMSLEFGRSRFCFAAPKSRQIKSIAELNGLRIATSYPELLKMNLKKLHMDCPVVRLDGAVELSVKLGIADAIADVVESGATMRQAGLEIVGEPLLHSEAILIGRDEKMKALPEVQRLEARLKGVIVASNYALIEYDIPRSALDKACELTPGVESPTVAPLSNPEWVAIKSMIKRDQVNRIMDELYEIGGRGIFVSQIKACRL